MVKQNNLKNKHPLYQELIQLAAQLDGSIHFDDLMRTIYATDASVYQELPAAVHQERVARCRAGGRKVQYTPYYPAAVGK